MPLFRTGKLHLPQGVCVQVKKNNFTEKKRFRIFDHVFFLIVALELNLKLPLKFEVKKTRKIYLLSFMILIFLQDFCEELEYWGLDDLHMEPCCQHTYYRARWLLPTVEKV